MGDGTMEKGRDVVEERDVGWADSILGGGEIGVTGAHLVLSPLPRPDLPT